MLFLCLVCYHNAYRAIAQYVVDEDAGGDARILDIAQREKMPKKIPEGMTELSVYVDKDVKLKFKVACTKQGKPMGEIVNTLLKDWLKTNE